MFYFLEKIIDIVSSNKKQNTLIVAMVLTFGFISYFEQEYHKSKIDILEKKNTLIIEEKNIAIRDLEKEIKKKQNEYKLLNQKKADEFLSEFNFDLNQIKYLNQNRKLLAEAIYLYAYQLCGRKIPEDIIDSLKTRISDNYIKESLNAVNIANLLAPNNPNYELSMLMVSTDAISKECSTSLTKRQWFESNTKIMLPPHSNIQYKDGKKFYIQAYPDLASLGSWWLKPIQIKGKIACSSINVKIPAKEE